MARRRCSIRGDEGHDRPGAKGSAGLRRRPGGRQGDEDAGPTWWTRIGGRQGRRAHVDGACGAGLVGITWLAAQIGVHGPPSGQQDRVQGPCLTDRSDGPGAPGPEHGEQSPRTRLDHLLDDHVGSRQPTGTTWSGAATTTATAGRARSLTFVAGSPVIGKTECGVGSTAGAGASAPVGDDEGGMPLSRGASGAKELEQPARGRPAAPRVASAQRPAGRHLWSTARRAVPRPGP